MTDVDPVDQLLSPKQQESIAAALDDVNHARLSLWEGSVRSGKTIGSLWAFAMLVASGPRGGAIVVVGRTRESIARNVFVPLADPDLFPGITDSVQYTAGAPTAKMFGRTVYVIGASDNRAEAVLRGLTVALAYVDEMTLVSEAFFTQLLARLSAPGARLLGTTNPDGPAHWCKKSVVDRAAELGYRIWHFDIDDNPFLDPAYVAQIKREYTGLWYRRFIKGEWVQAAGAVYDGWDEARHLIAPDAIPPMDRVLALGVDYGDVHATRGYLVGIGPDLRDGHAGEDRLYVLDEWAPGSMTVGGHSTDLRRWLATRPVHAWRTPEWVAYDHAASTFGHQLHHDGMTNVMKAHKAVLPGIRTVAALLAVDKLAASTTCKHLIDRLPGYVWDPKATERGETAPVKKDDDEVDALRYAVYSTRAFWTSRINVAPALDDAPGAGADVD